MPTVIEKYCKGKGLDVSIVNYLDKIPHFHKEHNNLYRLYPKYNFESLDFIFSNSSINTTKFSNIILKEWSYYIKEKGYIVIFFKNNSVLNKKKFKQLIEKYLKNTFTIVVEKSKRNQNLFVIQKIKKNPKVNNNEWSFGVITKGDRDDYINKFIESIRLQKIPRYEVIICGTYDGKYKKSKDVKYIHFTERDEVGWITKKKNIVCESAKYGNIFITHDRFKLSKDFYKGINKFGNQYDFAVPKFLDSKHEILNAYATEGRLFRPKAGLEYADYDKNIFFSGSCLFIKKDIWKKCKFEEKYYWNEEDLPFGRQANNKGYIVRSNIHSKVITFRKQNIQVPVYNYNNQKLGKLNFRYHKKLNDILFKELIKIYVGDTFSKVMGYDNFIRFMRLKNIIIGKRKSYIQTQIRYNSSNS